MAQTELITLGAISTGLLAFIGWLIREKFAQIDNHETRISRLEDSFVSADKVRNIVRTSVHPLEESVAALHTNIINNTTVMNGVLQEIAERRGYEKARKELKSGKKLKNLIREKGVEQ